MKNAFELQFHWMFIVVAGALILGFFVKIALEHENASKNWLYFDYSKKIDATFSSIIENPSMPINISIINDQIKFSCDQSCNCNYKVGTSNQHFNEKIIFAPEQATQIIQAFSLDWNVPFRAASFLFVTDVSKKYIFIYDDSGASQQILKIVSNTFKSTGHEYVDILDINKIKNRRLEYKFIFLNTKVTGLDKSFEDESVQGVLIAKARVDFLIKDKKQGLFAKTASYQIIPFDSNMITAAVISSKELFKCNMIKAFERLSFISKIYEKKSQNPEMKSFEGSRCAGSYSIAAGLFSELSKVAGEIADSQISEQINIPVLDIKNLNDNIERDSCPRII